MWGAIAALIGVGVDYYQSSKAAEQAHQDREKRTKQQLELDKKQERERKEAAARASERSRADSRRGRASNVLTGGSLMTEDSTTSARKTLTGTV